MEGPTPVSALIHAATMVTAGVFLILRLSPMFENSKFALCIITLGALTAFMSAFTALSQNDIKKVVAYSTCSQLGYMIMIAGYGHYEVSLFHLLNHGIFKALLFLAAGVVIHSTCGEQDTRKTGYSSKHLPLASISIVFGSVALLGLPFFSGFYSKDLLLEQAAQGHYFSLFAIVAAWLAAALTAAYSTMVLVKVFHTKPNYSPAVVRNTHPLSIHARLVLTILCGSSLITGYMMSNHIVVSPVMICSLEKLGPTLVTLASVIIALTTLAYIEGIVKFLEHCHYSLFGYKACLRSRLAVRFQAAHIYLSQIIYSVSFISMLNRFP